MSPSLHLMMMMTSTATATATATATPVDTGTNSPTVYVHLPSSPPVLILMCFVSFDSVSIVTGTPHYNTIDDNIGHMMILIQVLLSMYHAQVQPFLAAI